MAAKVNIDSELILDGLSQGVLIFDSANRLVQENAAARSLLGADMKLIRSEGWAAATVLLNSRLSDPARGVEAARAQAIGSGQPVRFHVYHAGERLPCWISALRQPNETLTMVTFELPDWTIVADVIEKYLEEVREVSLSTRGHIDLITRAFTHPKPNETIEQVGKKISGFSRVIDIHMYRLYALTDLVERLERVRTGKVREIVRATTRGIALAEFMEDFIEALEQEDLVDPETDAGDYRARIRTVIPQKLMVAAAPEYFVLVLRDLLRNAIMYSMRAAPIKIAAFVNRDDTIQIDVIDEGYGIRAAESERIFQPFTRSRQPQIMGEFGYGLSLYLCKNEVEAMNGHIWFQSEEGVGTTFSVKLPVWRESASSPKV